jgi:two-component system KDP operon response regulator KdpE
MADNARAAAAEQAVTPAAAPGTATKTRILVVDDEQAIRRLLRITLEAEGYEVAEARSGREAVDQVAAHRPELIILDLGLPDLDGFEVLQLLRQQVQTPVIVESVREKEADKMRALDSGADDYLTKPFGTGEFLSRIRAVLRRAAQNPPGPVFSSNGLEVDLARRIVTANGAEVHLSPTEFDLLRALVAQAGKVLTHRQLLRQVWGVGYEGESHLLRVTMGHLRHKLESDPARPRWIITEPGIGYRLRVKE